MAITVYPLLGRLGSDIALWRHKRAESSPCCVHMGDSRNKATQLVVPVAEAVLIAGRTAMSTMQLYLGLARPSYAGARVVVQERLDGRLLVPCRGKRQTPEDAPSLVSSRPAIGGSRENAESATLLRSGLNDRRWRGGCPLLSAADPYASGQYHLGDVAAARSVLGLKTGTLEYLLYATMRCSCVMSSK